jgi:spore coat polysaccharide biosynthesis predicted glycosyltransferase SpsG
VVVAGRFEGSFVVSQLAAAPVEVVPVAAPMAGGDPEPTGDLIRRLRPDLLHIDSYTDSYTDSFTDSCTHSYDSSRDLRDVGAGDVVFSNLEDGTFGRRHADVVIDPTFGAELSPRTDDGSTWLLRGSRYTPIRRRVMDARRRAVPVSPVSPVSEVARTVLVVMGGTDPVGLAPVAVDLLARTGLALEVTVIAVGENAGRVRAAARGSRLSLNVLAPVDDLAEMMSGHDLVISAAGTSVWELCCIGAPMAVVCAVENQREGYRRVVAAGAAVGLGGPARSGDERDVDLLRTALTNSRLRQDLVLAGRDVVDGLGAWRVVRTWEQVLRLGRSGRSGRSGWSGHSEPSHRVTARPAGLEDARQLWEWRNDPGTRAGSRQAETVPWLDHLAWLESSLTRQDRMLLVAQGPLDTDDTGGKVGPVGPVGTIRWDLVGVGEWEVSITVAPQQRGRSLARPLLRAAEVTLSEVARSRGIAVAAYLAVVHVDNHASARLFENSAYLPDLPPDPQGFMRFRKDVRVL